MITKKELNDLFEPIKSFQPNNPRFFSYVYTKGNLKSKENKSSFYYMFVDQNLFKQPQKIVNLEDVFLNKLEIKKEIFRGNLQGQKITLKNIKQKVFSTLNKFLKLNK